MVINRNIYYKAIIITETNKQTNKKTNKQTNNIYIYKCIFFFMIYKLQAYILYNIYNIVVIMVKNNKKLKNYLHRGPCTPYLSRDREIAWTEYECWYEYIYAKHLAGDTCIFVLSPTSCITLNHLHFFDGKKLLRQVFRGKEREKWVIDQSKCYQISYVWIMKFKSIFPHMVIA